MKSGYSSVGPITADWDQQQLEEYIAGHEIWDTKPRLEWLVGGLINRNWIADEGGKKYVARVFFDANVQGISEQSVLACSRAASEIGVSPQLRYSEPHLTLVDFIEGRHLTERELTDETIISGCMKLVRKLHAGTHAIRAPINYHGRFIVIRSLIKWSMENGNPHADAVSKMLPFVDKFEHRLRPFRPCFTHNDLAHVNVMMEPSGKLWLIDWDFGGIGHPLSDISDLLSYGPPTEELERFALRAYLDEDTPEDEFEATLQDYRISLLATYCFQYTWAAAVDHAVHKSPDTIRESMEAILPDQEASYQGFMKMAKERFDDTWRRFSKYLDNEQAAGQRMTG